jgi:hypothetical protein
MFTLTPETITVSFYNEDGGPGWFEGTVDLSSDLAERYALLLDGPNYTDTFINNVSQIVIQSDEAFVYLRRFGTSDRMHKVRADGVLFSSEINFRMLLPADSGAELILTFCRVNPDCELLCPIITSLNR